MRNAPPGVCLAVAPHWRREVAQVVGTLRDAARRDSSSGFAVVPLGSALASLALRRTDGIALLFSDASATRMHRVLRDMARGVPQFRLWWNDAAEVLTLTGGHPDATRDEVHLTFFAEAAAALAARGYTTACVPYLFTRPRETRAVPSEERIFYAAEIDISDSCFDGIDLGGAMLNDVSQRCWSLSQDVVEGRTTSVAADRELVSWLGEDAGERSVHRWAVWAMRNRIRYLLVKAVATEFGSRLDLYHPNWIELGFRASATHLTVQQCIDRYARVRVSLDVGGKSSHSSIYPRVADILSTAGAIVQFLPAGAPEAATPVLPQRQATTVQQLLTTIERVLQAPAAGVAEENAAMFEQYRAARLESGARLIEAISARRRRDAG